MSVEHIRGARWQSPQQVTRRVQIIFLCIALAQLPLCLPQFSVPSVGLAASLVAVVAMLALAGIWLYGQRRGRFSLWMEPCEAALVALVGLGLASPSAVLGIVYSGLAYRSLFGRHWLAAVRVVLYVAAVEVLAMSVGTRGDAIMEPARLAGWLLPSLALSAVTTRALAVVLRNHERAVERERTLGALGQGLFTAEDDAAVARLTTQTAESLAGMPAGTIVDVALGARQRDALDEKDSQLTGEFHIIALDAGTGKLGSLIVNSPKPLPAEVHKSLESLTNQAALALESVRLRSQLSHRADHDALTSLPNRALFTRRLETALTQCKPQHRVGVLFVDLDDFKTVNDGLGHAAGDELLTAVAERLNGARRHQDLVARLGGDEFAVLLNEVDKDAEALAVGTRMLQALQLPFQIQGTQVSVNSSIGIALSTSGQTSDELVRNADIAMYVAKARGKGRCELFTVDMHSAVNNRLVIKERLARALEAECFEIHYQPIMNVATGQISGCEALLRWHDPELGTIPPLEFIPVAESTGLIVPIEQWVLQRACTDAVSWPAAEDGRELDVSVNMSVAHLMFKGVANAVARALEVSGLAPHHLVIELTESVAALDPSITIANIQAIRNLGVRIALDDFGTGYSSLGILSTFPVDIVKIDKSFIDSERATLAKAVIDMSAALGLRSVAEGVESEEQLDWLSEFGCAGAQGYYFSKPVPAEQLPYLIRRYSRAVERPMLTGAESA